MSLTLGRPEIGNGIFRSTASSTMTTEVTGLFYIYWLGTGGWPRDIKVNSQVVPDGTPTGIQVEADTSRPLLVEVFGYSHSNSNDFSAPDPTVSE